MSDRGGGVLGHKLKRILIEQEYVINKRPAPSVNPQENSTIKRIHQGLGDILRSYHLQETYIDDADPSMGILAITVFLVQNMYHQIKQKSPGQLFLGET